MVWGIYNHRKLIEWQQNGLFCVGKSNCISPLNYLQKMNSKSEQSVAKHIQLIRYDLVRH